MCCNRKGRIFKTHAIIITQISKIKEGIYIYIHKCCKGSIKVEKYKRHEFSDKN